MNSNKYSEAIQFATIAHEGAYRKGTKIPYITHVVEAGLIAMSLTEDEDTIVAAILHDIVEDTSYELSDIEKLFGSRVAELVSFESEDKMKDIPAEDSWKIRKETFLNHLSNAPLEAKIICLADKLSNIRMSVKTHSKLGDDMWLVFNQKDKKMQEWYYRSIYEKLHELSDTDAYKEYVHCCDEVFGKQISVNFYRRYYPGTGEVMYDPLVPYNARIDGLVDFVSDELNHISCYFDKLGIADLALPYVFLSDKVIYRTYGSLSEKDLIKALEKYAQTMKKTDMYEYFMELINTIIQNLETDISENNENEKSESAWSALIPTLTGAERMAELEGTEDDKKVLSGIKDILSKRKVDKVLLLGEYLPNRHQVIIYYKTIEREINRIGRPDMDFLYAKLSSVIAHEFFHAMHHAMAPGHALWNNSSYRGVKGYQKNEIIESLADFFSVLWCYDQAKYNKGIVFMDVARERFDSWKKYLYSSWPYSKALYLMKNPVNKALPMHLDDESIKNGCDALLPVLETSVHNIVRSYELLYR